MLLSIPLPAKRKVHSSCFHSSSEAVRSAQPRICAADHRAVCEPPLPPRAPLAPPAARSAQPGLSQGSLPGTAAPRLTASLPLLQTVRHGSPGPTCLLAPSRSGGTAGEPQPAPSLTSSLSVAAATPRRAAPLPPWPDGGPGSGDRRQPISGHTCPAASRRALPLRRGRAGEAAAAVGSR